MEGVEWVLSRKPEEGTQIDPPHGPVWKVNLSPPPPQYVSVAIYYAFNDHEVILLDIRARTPID
jgi:hypothetical protein